MSFAWKGVPALNSAIFLARTGWVLVTVLAQLTLPRSGCVHASRALLVPQIGKFDAHT